MTCPIQILADWLIRNPSSEARRPSGSSSGIRCPRGSGYPDTLIASCFQSPTTSRSCPTVPFPPQITSSGGAIFRPTARAAASAALEAEASHLAATYNADLASGLSGVAGVHGIVVSTYQLVDAAVATRAAYGLTNVTTPVRSGNYTVPAAARWPRLLPQLRTDNCSGTICIPWRPAMKRPLRWLQRISVAVARRRRHPVLQQYSAARPMPPARWRRLRSGFSTALRGHARSRLITSSCHKEVRQLTLCQAASDPV
jgi:hypothetical protein